MVVRLTVDDSFKISLKIVNCQILLYAVNSNNIIYIIIIINNIILVF